MLQLSHNRHTPEPFLRLPPPHDNFIITLPRSAEEDAPHLVRTYNDPAVAKWLQAPPFPYTSEDAESWLDIIGKKYQGAWNEFQDLQERQQKQDGSEIKVQRFVSEPPVQTIREALPDGVEVWIGGLEIERHGFEEVLDTEMREELVRRNEERPVGDKDIVWTVRGGWSFFRSGDAPEMGDGLMLQTADCLAPSHHGRGIMTAAVGALRKWAVENMNVHLIRTILHEGNIGSFRVFEKLGFRYQETVKDAFEVPETKGGGKRSYQVLSWTRSIDS